MDQSKPKAKSSLEDYTTIGQLGRGAYGEVVLARRKIDNMEVAIKVIDKRFLMREKKQYQVFIEREMLLNFKHPGIVQLFSTFQKPDKLYFVLEYLEGGDLADFLKLHRKNLKYETLQFYMAEIVVALEYLHCKGIAHRDLKPENLMLTKQGHLKLIDFGTSTIIDESFMPKQFVQTIKQIKNQKQTEIEPTAAKRATFVGTAEYVSPELLEEETCEYAADLWALGVICYKMFTGVTPFLENSEYLVFQNVKNVKYTMAESIPPAAADLISKLLIRDPKKRLGSDPQGELNNYSLLKSHPFFKGIQFNKIFEQKAPQYKVVSIKQVDKSIDPDLELGQNKKKSKLKFFGVIQLKVGWFLYRPLDLVLIEGKEFMKLAFYDPEIQKTQFKLKLDDSVEIYSPNNGVMQIDVLQKKKYYIKEVEHPIEKWIEIIERTKKELKSKKKEKQQKQQM